MLRPGVLSTVQDLGRPGRRELGVPLAGAADAEALRLGNALVGNPPGAAGLEITLGGVFELEEQLLIALTGADLSAEVTHGGARRALPLWRALWLPAGSVLHTGRARQGCRLYLSVAGGVAVPPVLGSASTYLPAGFGGFEGRALQKGDRLKVGQGRGLGPPNAFRGTFWAAPWYLAPPGRRQRRGALVRAVAGPEAAWFAEAGGQTFWHSWFEVGGHADRMGIRLEGPPPLERARSEELPSAAVSPGTVQVPANGQPIVLLADGQTVGGYPRVAQVVQADLPICAQLAPGQRMRFHQVSVAEARALYLRRERALRALERAARARWAVSPAP